ncbi:nucleotidyltransferase family protein [Catenovulum sp. 2E275]|uniref:N-acetylmuramate alpha-1-phosphate uridylyltransferase MurU n=1 Tax=Catenovulum sp. 2E275 TaxID=2980497 RepID=UPI0021CE55EC|nr:nucleotidyltransferase family protein [Catenovulum sp. 2E275]MCU4675092.1 nucleotidyltransferase family protein [Catenovulum sp. 2E275]
MKAMILAAGKGTRMQPLTLSRPKPLLEVNHKSLIEYQIEALVKAGISDIIINHAYLGEQIPAKLGNGSNYNCRIQYSPEKVDEFETAGGIINALPLLGNQPFVVVNADIWCDFNYAKLTQITLHDKLAHIVLVDNPEHNLSGDFGYQNYLATQLNQTNKSYTFSGIAVYHPDFFNGEHEMPLALGKLLRKAISLGKVSAEIHNGQWSDIGTPERLAQIKQRVEKGLNEKK